jgi:hypothetical protein
LRRAATWEQQLVSDVRRHLFRVITAVLASALVAGALVGLDAEPAEAKVPRAAARYTAAIEPLAAYVGQATCSPVAKRGTTAFANLLLRTYPKSRSLGISRSCGVGGKSEHKEGRAFDWGVSVHRAADRKAVNDLMRWLLQTDRFGNRHAMARRLGIQYMIWNGRIWGAYAAGSGWRKYTGSNPHTDHVHFSLSWAGARKKTSFWNPRNFPNSSGVAPNQPKPSAKPEPDRPSGGTTRPGDRHDWPDPRPDERVRQTRANPEPRAPKRLERGKPVKAERLVVPSRRRAGTLTRGELVAGRHYLVEVSGTYRYDRRRGSLADAECSTRRGASWWQRERSLRPDQWYADHLDLYVDGNDLQAHADDGGSCDAGNTYRWIYEPRRTGRVPFAVWDPDKYKDNSGRLVVRVLDLGEVRDTMTWRVPSRERAGATSPGLLRGGQAYLVTVSGTWKNGRGGEADAECFGADGRWRRDVDTYDMVAGEWDYRSLSPRMSGVRTLPVSGGDQCDPGHTYTWVHRPYRTSPLNVRVSDPDGHGDNTGALKVSVRPHDGSSSPTEPTSPSGTPLPGPAPVVGPEQVSVDSRSSTPVSTTQSYPAGTALRVTATGAYFLRSSYRNWIAADAECTATSSDYRWRSARDGLWGVWNGTGSPLGDLAVNGAIVEWKPSDGGGSCDSHNHVYTYDLTTKKEGKVSFVVVDSDYGDNKGVLEVSVEAR